MADQPATPPNEPAGTGGGEPQATPPAATQEPTGSGGATKDDGETITLSKKDYTNLVSQRDKNATEASANSEFVLTIAKEREIDAFLDKNKEKFPDVSRADLMYLDDPEQLEEAAAQMQTRLDDHAQAKLKDIQISGAPELTPEQRSEKLKSLKKSAGNDAFDKMLELKDTGGVLQT